VRLDLVDGYFTFSDLFPGNIPVYTDGSFSYKGREYVIGDSSKGLYIFHFYTSYFPKTSTFVFDVDSMQSVFGSLREFSVDGGSYYSPSLLGKALRFYLDQVYKPKSGSPDPKGVPICSSRRRAPGKKVCSVIRGGEHTYKQVVCFSKPILWVSRFFGRRKLFLCGPRVFLQRP
jgi:hypothetical protein